VATDGAAKVARTQTEKGQSRSMEGALVAACAQGGPIFAAREERVPAATNLEIARGPDFQCKPSLNKAYDGKAVIYLESQYRAVRDFYLAASLAADRYLNITTHFLVDARLQGHCDPHCFDLTHLYALIATALGHGVGSTYGIAPTYGPKWGNAVWWDKRICGGKDPPK
jgi:hypothetical protein